MEMVIDSEFIYKILVIREIWEDEGTFHFIFETQTERELASKEYYELSFSRVVGMEYSIMAINRLRFSKLTAKDELNSNICLIENSEWIKNLDEYFIDIYQPKNLKHYLIIDSSDTVIDILADGHPTLEKISKPEGTKLLKEEIEQLRWWKNKENLTAIQDELKELREYKIKREKEDKQAREDEINANSFGF
ncbi:hypothetical protein [Lactococcus protaetiae]|uniref:Uncharacterized protein n=1 Tax=Lactococcus protaetiae TaxID=2592653 RepID=A0A514Z715_9LACT|nr:hypothetical protein [Lactococcus protaetiae]QDK70399.1 hypothetical protein FLP15_03450 [Lactococcus protaetiae]